MAISTSEISTRLFKKVLGLGETSSSNKQFYEELFNGPLVSYNNNVWTDINKIPTSLSGTTNVVNLPIGSYINPDGTTGSTKNDSVLQVSAWTLNIVLGTNSGTEGFAFVNTNAVDVIPFNYDSIFSYDTNNSIRYNNGAANLAFGSNGSIFDPQSGILKFYEPMPGNWDGTSPFVIKGVKYIGNKLSNYDLDSFNNNVNEFTGFTQSFNAYSAYTENIINNNYNQFTGFTQSFGVYSANTLNLIDTKYDKSGGTISGDVTIIGNLIVNGTATTVNTVNILVYDPIIGLALVQSGSTNPTLDSGFIIDRGLSGNTGFVWIENNKQFELGYTNNSYNDTNITINQHGNLKLNNLKTSYITDSSNSTGITNQVLSSTNSGVVWSSIDGIITGVTSNKVIELGTGVLSTVRINSNNIASGNYSGVLSGTGNTASGNTSVVVGGLCNTASGQYSFIGGGRCNTVSGFYSSIGGGCRNQSSNNSFVGGGVLNTVSDCFSFIGGGQDNTVNSNYNTIGGGRQNKLITSSNCSTISGGYKNTGNCSGIVIGGGISNTTLGQSATIAGGGVNIVTASGCYGTIAGGRLNRLSGRHSTVSGGYSNTASGNCSFIGGGCRNTASGSYSGVLGGFNNLATATSSFVIGSNLTGSTSNTTFVENLSINGLSQTNALYTTITNTLTTGLNSLYIIPTRYDASFIDYIAKCNNNYRAGQLMSTWGGNTIVFNETTTVDIGNTNAINFSMIISGGSPVFVTSATTSGWNVKSIIRSI